MQIVVNAVIHSYYDDILRRDHRAGDSMLVCMMALAFFGDCVVVVVKSESVLVEIRLI